MAVLRPGPVALQRMAVAFAAAALGQGCPAGEPSDTGLGPEGDRDRDPDVDGDADLDADADSDGEDVADEPRLVSGPLTLVESGFVVLLDRPCDLDGDGVGDNAIADLGEPYSTLFATAIGATAVAMGESKLAFHLPWVADLATPSGSDLILVLFSAMDTDVPANPDDDYSGEEPFWVVTTPHDACGDNVAVVRDVRIDAGELSHPPMDGFPALPGALEMDGARIWGRLDAFGAAASLTACGFARPQDLGAISAGGLTWLEQLLAGRFLSVLPDAPGLSPDVDLDGDGLERFSLDDADRIARCIDGDGFTVIEGRDCWQDPRIVDAFSLVLGFDLVRGRLVGRAPGWEYDLGRACEDGGLEGVFGFGEAGPGCARLDQVCDPRSAGPCCDPAHRCSGASRIEYRCLAACEAAPCAYGRRTGTCVSEACWPIDRPEERVACTPGEPCTTEYGEEHATACVQRDARTLCLETCEGAAEPCGDDRHECRPVVGEDTGVCASLAAGDT